MPLCWSTTCKCVELGLETSQHFFLFYNKHQNIRRLTPDIVRYLILYINMTRGLFQLQNGCSDICQTLHGKSSCIILIPWFPQIKVNKIKGLFWDFSRTFCSIFNHCISSKIIKPWNPTTVSILLDYTLWTNSFSLIRRECILPYTITFVIWYSTLPGNIFKWLFSRTNIRRNVKEWQVSWISCDTFYA